jgi:phospholipid transport system substrate-binding protein
MKRALIILVAGALLAAPSAGPVTEQLRRSIDRVIAILSDPALQGPAMTTARRDAVRRVMDEAIDFPEAAKRALGAHWRGRTDAERAEFIALFKDLVEYSYIVRIEPYAGQQVVYLGETIEEDRATVRTRLENRQGQDLLVDYRLHRPGDRWLVYDVSIAGVSLVANYRTQFNSIIQTSSYAELLVRMKARVRELAAPPAIPA